MINFVEKILLVNKKNKTFLSEIKLMQASYNRHFERYFDFWRIKYLLMKAF